METTFGPSASIQYLCVSDEHVRLGHKVRDGEGHLTIRSGQWAYCAAGRKDEPHEWEATAPLTFYQIRHASIMRRSGHPTSSRSEQEQDRSG